MFGSVLMIHIQLALNFPSQSIFLLNSSIKITSNLVIVAIQMRLQPSDVNAIHLAYLEPAYSKVRSW